MKKIFFPLLLAAVMVFSQPSNPIPISRPCVALAGFRCPEWPKQRPPQASIISSRPCVALFGYQCKSK